ncbi:MAG: hypothetical protein GC171_02965 [Terrimonas sp.]|nr:hypothetical protein [Terrimonas sp.]
MKKNFIFFGVLFIQIQMMAQDKPYYYQIPEAPASYTATNVAARLVDGLGFRYFWATEGLRPVDLAFKPSDSARTSLETLEHIYGLTNVLLNAVQQKPTQPSNTVEKLSFESIRAKTLQNIQKASEILKKQQAKLEDFDMIFERPNGSTSFPFWNLVNGPISDALWHVGQVVTFRRSSGNPLPKGVNVLQGTKTEF